MAKKKSQSHDLKPHSQPQTPMANGDPSVQIQNLKNLNSVLLKETTHHRQQIQSLQSALHHSTMSSDTNLSLHLQHAVLLVFVDTQVKEMALHFDTLVGDKKDAEYEVVVLKREMNDITQRFQNEKNRLSVLTQERDNLKDELVAESTRLEEIANREKNVREEAEKLRFESENLLEKVSEKERVIQELKKDREFALKGSQESLKVIEKLKEEIDVVTRERNEVEKSNNAQERKIGNLELDLKQLNESLKNSRNEEEFMRAKVLHLEGNLEFALQKEEVMKTEISALLEEKKEMEEKVEMLIEKKDSVDKVLGMVQKELEDKQKELDDAVRVKGEIEQVKVDKENEIVELRGEVDRLRDIVDGLKESSRVFEEELLSQVNHYRNAIDEVVLEKDNIKKGFDDEKKNVESLKLEITRKEEMIEKSFDEREKLVEKHMELETLVDVLMKEKNAQESILLRVQRESDELRAKIEFWSSNSNMALAMLKSTAAFVCQYKNRGEEEVTLDAKLVEEMQPYAEELNAIKKAFKSKNEMVDEMKQQLVSMQKSMVEAHKNKSLWTVISSATTIFAAALAAYVARGR
ncbi:hypothetical protein RJT34_22901 [Clitoria ternatea]|uniref:Uncharacterized protein n=1 Tax=Clitoria ternatea TaxID=43366 RepID=A0AAN9IG04_CLITE